MKFNLASIRNTVAAALVVEESNVTEEQKQQFKHLLTVVCPPQKRFFDKSFRELATTATSKTVSVTKSATLKALDTSPTDLVVKTVNGVKAIDAKVEDKLTERNLRIERMVELEKEAEQFKAMKALTNYFAS